MSLTGALGTLQSTLANVSPGGAAPTSIGPTTVTGQLGTIFSFPDNLQPGVGASSLGNPAVVFNGQPGAVQLAHFQLGGAPPPIPISNYSGQLAFKQTLAHFELGGAQLFLPPVYSGQLGYTETVAHFELGAFILQQGAGTSNHYTANVSDTVTVTDAVVAGAHYPIPLADTIPTNEALTLHATHSTSQSDTVSVTDAMTPSAGVRVSTSDTVAVTDAVQAQFGKSAHLSDTVTVSDAVTTMQGLTVAANDTVVVAEATALHQALSKGIADTVTITDAVIGSRGGPPVSLSETVTVTDAGSAVRYHAQIHIADTIAVSDSLSEGHLEPVHLSETVAISEALAIRYTGHISIPITVAITENLSAGSAGIISGGTQLSVTFPVGLRIDGALDPDHYTIRPVSGGGFPIGILGISPITENVRSGTAGTVLTTHSLQLDGTFSSSDVGNYIFLGTPMNPTGWLRITSVPSSNVVVVDQPIITTDPANGAIPWHETSAVLGAIIQTTKQTNAAVYQFGIDGIKFATSENIFSFTDFFPAVASKPQIASAVPLGDGQILVTFTDPMLDDVFLTDPDEYSLTGTPQAFVDFVRTVSPTQVVLTTAGMGNASYTLTVNATGTPHDIAGNPIDPVFNTVIFTGAFPITARSIFVDNGPITKPPLQVAANMGIVPTFPDFSTITLPGASFGPSVIGLYLVIQGSAHNDGSYIITAVVSATTLRVKASFVLPDSNTISWQVLDPRDGEIADDPSDVTVRINGVPTTPLAVVGLLGQIVMASAPTHGSTVSVDYSWVCNPVVDMRRLNSKEFRFNNWNRNIGGTNDPSGHQYRFNNTLVVPSSFVPLDVRSKLAQPLQRDLKYRAYERAYTALFNDPNTLLLNSPTNKIAFPPLQRQIVSTFVNYQAVVLPENDPLNPWVRHGTGTATIVNNELVIQDTSSGAFPTGQPIFWTSAIDLTFQHVFASAWRMTLNQTPVTEGVFTGVSAGYSDGQKCVVIGYLLDGGVAKIGVLKAGAGNDPSLITSWGGGVDTNGNPTGAPVIFDWSTLHSYRLFQDLSGIIHLFFDGSVVDGLRALETDLPFLSELNDPFNQIQGAFFGSLSRPATNTSTWDFVRYTIQPTNPLQTAPSVFVSYEGDRLPEVASQPWTPVGFHGTETISNNDLILDSTSATDLSTEGLAGLISGDFRGYVRIEPLLRVASDVVLDVNVQLRTFTHGITPNAVMAAVDDGDRLLQLCFFPDKSAPLLSYGGRSFPDQFSPYVWSKLGGATSAMVGQLLRITDASVTDGLVYFIDDTQVPSSSNRVVSATNDYVLEFRCRVNSHTPDGSGFAGVSADVYDGLRDVGVFLRDTGAGAANKFVVLQSEGLNLVQFQFNWDDGQFHTYRIVKSTGGNLVTLFVDTTLIGTEPYSTFLAPANGPNGVITFGSSSIASMSALSVVDWAYCNAWRVNTVAHHYVGIWRGFDPNALTGYHLPLKTNGRQADINGNALGDPNATFISDGVVIGDVVVIDSGANKGVYTIASVPSETVLTFGSSFPSQPSAVDYRIPREVDWTTAHRYRIVRDPGGGVALLLDTNPQALIRIGYNSIDLPSSLAGLPSVMAGGLPSVVWGAFDPTNISQTAWDFLRYGVTRPLSEMQVVPHHEVLNQRNIMASYEHHTTSIAHTHTDFWSESEGIPPQTSPDFLANTSVVAYTLLNEGTPLVPSTQTYEVRRPTPVLVPIASFNNPQDILNSQSFLMNESEETIQIVVPDDVLYNSLQVIETDTGSPNLIAPFDDECQPYSLGTLYFQNVSCLTYDGGVLPELDTSAVTPWTFQADDPSHVTKSAFAGVLTYGTDGTGTRTIYRNNTPLPDSISLQTQVTFRLKLLNDSSSGLGDSQVRFGLSAPGMTAALAFVTNSVGQRYVLIIDQNSGLTVGGIPFDFLDGNFHTYRLVRSPTLSTLQVFIDS